MNRRRLHIILYSLLIIYVTISLVQYFYLKNQISEKIARIEKLKALINKNEKKVDQIEKVKTLYYELGVYIDSAIQNKKNKITVKLKETPKKETPQEEDTTQKITLKKEIPQEEDTTQKEKPQNKPLLKRGKNKTIKRVYPYSNRNGKISLNDVFIRIEYNPNNDNIINSMTDYPKRIKVNNSYVQIISAGEYFDDDDNAFYIIMIKLYEGNLKVGKNKISIIDNINREHKAYFEVID